MSVFAGLRFSLAPIAKIDYFANVTYFRGHSFRALQASVFFPALFGCLFGAVVLTSGCTSKSITDVSPSSPATDSIQPMDSTVVQVATRGTAPVAVLTQPSAAVIFEAHDGGVFENGHHRISVNANPDGRAQVNYRATPGIIGHVRVTARRAEQANPIVRFRVEIQSPDTSS